MKAIKVDITAYTDIDNVAAGAAEGYGERELKGHLRSILRTRVVAKLITVPGASNGRERCIIRHLGWYDASLEGRDGGGR